MYTYKWNTQQFIRNLDNYHITSELKKERK